MTASGRGRRAGPGGGGRGRPRGAGGRPRAGGVGCDRLVQGTITGTAVSGSDYTLSTPGGIFANAPAFDVTIPAGQTSITVPLTPIFHAQQEGPETAIFTVEGTSATVTIADEPAVTIA